MIADRRMLIEGEHVSPWATMKLARSVEHFNAFFARVESWNSSRTFRAPLRISADREFIEFLMPVGNRPPLDEWGLLFGDAVHNLRAALDCVTWDLAHLDGGVPKNPKQVAFPVLKKSADWTTAAARLSSVPPEFLTRIESVQPYNDGDQSSAEDSWLSIITSLDNEDKHRGVVTGVPQAEKITLEGLGIRLGETRPGMEGRVETRFDLDALADGDPFARFSFGALITEGSLLPTHAVVALGACVRYNDKLIPVAQLQNEAVGRVYAVIQYLLSGSDPSNSTVIHPEGART